MEEVDLTHLNLEDIEALLLEEPTLELKYLSDETPDYDGWTLPLLIGYDVNGRLREWQIWFQGEYLHSRHGLQDGEKQVDIREVRTNQSGRTLYEQAWLEAKQRYSKMMKKGYRMDGETDSNLFKVMRAQIYTRTSKLEFPAFYDYKLNGYRHYITSSNGGIQGYSREGALRTQFADLDEDLKILFQFLPPETILDTELYRHGMDFEDISSAIRTQLREHEDLHLLQIHIFDACWDRTTPFEQRRSRLESAIEKFYLEMGIEFRTAGRPQEVNSLEITGPARRVTLGRNFLIRPSVRIRLTTGYLAYDRDELDEAMVRSVRPLLEDHHPYSSINLRRGYEGIMIKRLSHGASLDSQIYKMSSYFYGKCAHIYKYKEVLDMEGLCIGVEDSTGREQGCAMLKMLLTSGITFMLKMDGSQDRRRLWFDCPELILGRLLTFTYQCLSKEGVPMFAVGRRIREDLSTDNYRALVVLPTLSSKEREVLISLGTSSI